VLLVADGKVVVEGTEYTVFAERLHVIGRQLLVGDRQLNLSQPARRVILNPVVASRLAIGLPVACEPIFQGVPP
jgi:hypothetical protein